MNRLAQTTDDALFAAGALATVAVLVLGRRIIGAPVGKPFAAVLQKYLVFAGVSAVSLAITARVNNIGVGSFGFSNFIGFSNFNSNIGGSFNNIGFSSVWSVCKWSMLRLANHGVHLAHLTLAENLLDYFRHTDAQYQILVKNTAQNQETLDDICAAFTDSLHKQLGHAWLTDTHHHHCSKDAPAYECEAYIRESVDVISDGFLDFFERYASPVLQAVSVQHAVKESIRIASSVDGFAAVSQRVLRALDNAPNQTSQLASDIAARLPPELGGVVLRLLQRRGDILPSSLSVGRNGIEFDQDTTVRTLAAMYTSVDACIALLHELDGGDDFCHAVAGQISVSGSETNIIAAAVRSVIRDAGRYIVKKVLDKKTQANTWGDNSLGVDGKSQRPMVIFDAAVAGTLITDQVGVRGMKNEMMLARLPAIRLGCVSGILRALNIVDRQRMDYEAVHSLEHQRTAAIAETSPSLRLVICSALAVAALHALQWAVRVCRWVFWK